MKNDIDFDELDRAVNSLMGGVAGGSPRGADDAPKAKTLSISSTLKPGEVPAYEKVDEVAKNIGSETLTTDNDSATIKNLDELSHTDSQSISISTTNSPVVAQPVVDMPQPTTIEQSKTPQEVVAPRPSSGRFMDVVHPSSDMKLSSPQQPVTVADVIPPVPIIAPAQTITTTVSDVELTSPFLADAKVEKRPLGDPSSPAKEVDYSHNDAPEEIVAINSEAMARHNSGKDTQEILDASKFDSVSSVDQELQAIESMTAVAPPENQAEALRAVESVDAGTAEPEQGAIFDVKDYHQPLAHPPKRKSGWGVVVIIVIIIILAAAVGAGAYFLL